MIDLVIAKMRLVWIVAGGIATLLLALVVLSVRAEMVDRVKARQSLAYYAQLERDMGEHIPVGTSYDQVAAYLQRQGIPYSYRPEERAIYILFEDVRKSWIISTGIQVIITFDDQRRLQGIAFRTFGTGP